jgi:hypothetical protein
MRTNIINNLIPNNYFIRRKKPIYVDSTNKIYVQKFGNECTNLEIVYKNQTNTFINQNLKEVELNDNSPTEIDGIIFNSEISTQSKIHAQYYYNRGPWKTINNNNLCDEINNITIEYPIKLMEPNLILVNNEDYSLTFTIQDNSIFNNKDTFTVYLTPVDLKLKLSYVVQNNVVFDTTKNQYTITFNSSVFLNPNYSPVNNKYYLVVQSNISNKLFLSDPSRSIFVASTNLEIGGLSNIVTFNAHKQNLNYYTHANSNLLINYYVSGLPSNSYFNLKIIDLHDTIPIYYSPPILFTGDKYYIQSILISDDINNHNYNLCLEYNGINIIDLKSEIIIDLDYNYNVSILNINQIKNITNTSSFDLKLYIDPSFVNTVVNISLDNYFIKNDIITNNNYYNYVLPVTLNETFDSGRYNVKVQVRGNSNYCAKSNEYIFVNNPYEKFYSQIMPNFGYNNIPFSYNNTYNPIKLSGYYVVPYGVTQLDINMIYNGTQITGQVVVQANSVVYISYGILMINNREIINIITGNYIINRIINFMNKSTNNANQILIKYICETGYIIKLHNWDSTIKSVDLNIGNNSDGLNLVSFGTYTVNYSSVYGYYIKIDKTSMNFTGELYFYWNSIYLDKLTLIDYPINFGLNLVSNLNNVININSVVSGTILINNYNLDFPTIETFNLYFVDDLYGNNPYYLSSIINTNNNILLFSFRYLLNNVGTKYLMIKGSNNNFIINHIIDTPISVIAAIVSTLTDPINNRIIKKAKVSPTTYSAAPAKVIIGVYTTFDKSPNKTTPSNFLQTYGLYTYNNVPKILGSNYANYNGFLLLQCDSLSNGVSQTNTTLDTFTTFLIAQLASKQINLITTPAIFKDTYTTNNFVTDTHTFEYYNNTIFNNEEINKQSSLCSNVVQNGELITDISIIKTNFSQAYNNEIRNYTGQNALNNQVSQLTNSTDKPPRFAWIENLGHYISQYFQLSINNVEIEKITSDWINIWNDINIKPGHKSGYNKLIGNVPSLTSYTPGVLPSYKLRIPLPFYFNRYNNAGLSIPLISLLHSDVKLTLQMEQLQNLIISDPLTKFITTGRPKLNLELKYIYLENEERRRFATSKHEYLIEQENYRNYSHYGTSFNTKLNFMQPVKDLYWFAQPKTNTTNINSKQYYNYTNSKYYINPANYDRYDEVNPITTLSRQVYAPLYTAYPNVNYIPYYVNNKITKSNIPFTTKSPINNTILRLNGQKRFDEDSDLTQLVHFHKYTNIPQSGIHAYPFCLYPNEYQPSGSCNFSVLGDAYFELDTDDGAYNVGIIARNYNLLRIMSGQAGLAFEL